VQFIALFFAACLGFAALTARAAHTQVQLLLSANPARPGDTIWAGVDLKMDAGWHTYWKNPGAAGIGTEIKWQLPPGVTAGEIQWPLPEKLPPAEVTTYGYKNEVMLIVPLTLASNLPAGQITLKADVSWLECKDECIPASTTIHATLNIGSETKNSAEAATIDLWKEKVPTSSFPFPIFANWEESSNSDTHTLIINIRVDLLIRTLGHPQYDFYPDSSDSFEIQAATEQPEPFTLRKIVRKFSGNWPNEISGVLVVESRKSRLGYNVNLKVTEPKIERGLLPGVLSEKKLEADETPALPLMLLYAFIGGLILNIMPCVLPVIALKILGFVQQSESSPGRVRAMGLVYAAGVLVSFLALAAIVIGVKAAGHLAGWGMQFGNPIFLVCITTLVTLVALNLFGVFEVTFGGRALDAAGNLASRHGAGGAFFNGVLATALATPCTAPFLGAALGFAFLQPPAIIILIFLFVGLGLSAPYVLLSWNPALLKFLPKPGAWMEKFKIAMGFPMLATALWLFNIAGSSYGKSVIWLGLFLVVVALAAWIFGEFVQRGRRHKMMAAFIALILLIGGYAFALEDELDWRAPVAETNANGSLKESADGIAWQRWSPEAVAQARKAGKPVLVDFTADWCLTCQVNKKTSIEIPSVRAKLKKINAVALIGDYTHTPDNITVELERYHRAGVPLVLVYPKKSDGPAIVLPEVLTPGIVLDALDRAG
jgi:thiol:disulfide interchange protein DsbD